MIYGNSLRHKLPNEWAPGVVFSSKNILRFAIVFYGFRVTYQQVFAVGMDALIIDAIIVIGTFLIGWQLGTRVFGLDRDSSMLIASGLLYAARRRSSLPGYAKEQKRIKYPSVTTVVIFGTIAMFLYPMLYNSGILGFDAARYICRLHSTRSGANRSRRKRRWREPGNTA